MSENAQLNSDTYERDQVVKIINSVIDKVQQNEPVAKDVLAKELLDLKNIIEEARREVCSANPGDIKGVHIPTATDELDAVVGATEEATGAIMDCCDVIQQNTDKMDAPVAEAIGAEVTKIYEACSFQDITGQRITKVVQTLQAIEEKVGKILKVVEDKMPGMADPTSTAAGEAEGSSGPDSLLNGPQMPDKAISQDDIDKLLAEFD